MRTNKVFFKLFFLLFINWSSLLNAQNIERSVIANAGGYYENLIFGNLHWTVGEIAVARLQNEIELGEGFHRSYYDLIVKTTDILPFDWDVIVYPNPTIDQLQVKMPEGKGAALQLFSSSGQLLIYEKAIQLQTVLDVSHLPAATYWLRLFDQNGHQRNFQIQKIKN